MRQVPVEPTEAQSTLEDRLYEVLACYMEDVETGRFNSHNAACRAAAMLARNLQPGNYLRRLIDAQDAGRAALEQGK